MWNVGEVSRAKKDGRRGRGARMRAVFACSWYMHAQAGPGGRERERTATFHGGRTPITL